MWKTLIQSSKIFYRKPPAMPPQQWIVDKLKNKVYTNDNVQDFLADNDFLMNKKVISISPGGFKGIYMFGVCVYIRDTFDIDNFIFTGASAGAWNSLLLCYKKDPLVLKSKVLDYSLTHANTLNGIELSMKSKLLEHTTTNDYDLRRLFIGVTTFQNLRPSTTIFHGFTNLEDAIDCCIASSHIPFVTGGFLHKYTNHFSFDGGFSKYPYLNISKPAFHVYPSIWKERKKETGYLSIYQYTTLFSRKDINFVEMYQSGYEDAKQNYAFLKYFLEDVNDI
jgi:hypothetical protein